tara:strand:- start:427 stop:699 length:273 start_codon:yes stop_codon:yes gene_type:complete
MKDKEILEELHRRLQVGEFGGGFRSEGHLGVNRFDVKDFIEQEWQKRDEQELVDQYNRNRKPEDYIMDVSEIERHRGLEIGPDGTVISLD